MKSTSDQQRAVFVMTFVTMGLLFFCCASPCLFLGTAPQSDRDWNSPSEIEARRQRAYDKMQSGRQLTEGDLQNLAEVPMPNIKSDPKILVNFGLVVSGIGVIFILLAFLGFVDRGSSPAADLRDDAATSKDLEDRKSEFEQRQREDQEREIQTRVARELAYEKSNRNKTWRRLVALKFRKSATRACSTSLIWLLDLRRAVDDSVGRAILALMLCVGSVIACVAIAIAFSWPTATLAFTVLIASSLTALFACGLLFVPKDSMLRRWIIQLDQVAARIKFKIDATAECVKTLIDSND